MQSVKMSSPLTKRAVVASKDDLQNAVMFCTLSDARHPLLEILVCLGEGGHDGLGVPCSASNVVLGIVRINDRELVHLVGVFVCE